MRKRVLAAALTAGMFLAGCGVAGEAPADTTAQIEMTVPAMETVAPFEQGQAVFVVYDSDGIVGMRRLFVVEVTGGIVIATTAVPGSGEEGELLAYSIDNCYADETEACKASGMEPME